MVPKRKQIQEGLSRLELWVDRTTQLLVAMRMTFPNGDTKLMTFADVKPNAPIDPSVFSVERAESPGRNVSRRSGFEGPPSAATD